MTDTDSVQSPRNSLESTRASRSRESSADDWRIAAERADERADVSISLAVLWKELTLGLCHVVDSFCTNTRLFLVTQTVRTQPQPLPPACLHVLQAVLGGACQNNVAIDLGVAPSTVATRARLGLARLGVSQLPSHASPLLMLTARSACLMDYQISGSLSFVEHRSEILRVIGLRRPDLAPPNLTPAEVAVVRGIVEGLTYAKIAAQRGTSRRTIANQLASVFRRFSISGRSELVLRLFDAQRNAPAERNA